MGMALTTYMRSWADFEYVSAVTLPLFLFSATFYPLSSYGDWAWVVQLSPLYHGVALVRGRQPRRSSEWSMLGHVAVLVAMAVVGLVVASAPSIRTAAAQRDATDPPRGSPHLTGREHSAHRNSADAGAHFGARPYPGIHALPHQDRRWCRRPRRSPGRTDQTMPVPETHFVNGHPLQGPWPEGYADGRVRPRLLLGRREAVLADCPACGRRPPATPVATRPNPTYEEVCSGRTGHAEVVLVVFDPAVVTYEQLLKAFWEDHDPSQGMRQGNDVGTQYRSAIYYTDDEQRRAAEATKADVRRGPARPPATATSRRRSPRSATFYYAEPYHQQYLAKNPGGYCPLHATGVSCSIG